MSGITFFYTTDLEKTFEFYLKRTNSILWIDQGCCKILKNGNMIFGFCEKEDAKIGDEIITFFYDSMKKVDSIYAINKDIALSEPSLNKKFNIYHFFAKDIDGRKIEFQYFNHEIDFDF